MEENEGIFLEFRTHRFFSITVVGVEERGGVVETFLKSGLGLFVCNPLFVFFEYCHEPLRDSGPSRRSCVVFRVFCHPVVCFGRPS